MGELKRTVLFDLHQEYGAKTVPFAGWEMPVQFAPGVMKEHLHTRTDAGLFDVSHMAQVILRAGDAARALETLVPVDVIGLKPGRQRYAMFTTPEGGLIDDLMVANKGDHLFLVLNAARREVDLAHLHANLPGVEIEEITGRALIALQGPRAEEVLASLNPAVRDMRFMDVADHELAGATCWISRSGYTGEDGYEISVPNTMAPHLARTLLEHDAVAPIGLGARDSLRLEAGLCLYGSDIDETTTPAEADLGWAIQKVRRPGGAREGGFPGADRILAELANGPDRRRVGLSPEGRTPMRAGTALFAGESGGDAIGTVTSGAFGPSIGRPMSMGYVPAGMASPGTKLYGDVRGKRLPVTVVDLPFHPHAYKR